MQLAPERTVRVTDHEPRATGRVTGPRRLPPPPPTSFPRHLALWPREALPGWHIAGHPRPAPAPVALGTQPWRRTDVLPA